MFIFFDDNLVIAEFHTHAEIVSSVTSNKTDFDSEEVGKGKNNGESKLPTIWEALNLLDTEYVCAF